MQTFARQVPGWNMGAQVFSTYGRWPTAVGSSSAIGDHAIGIFNTDTGRLRWVIRLQTDLSFGADIPLGFSPDGKFIYTTAEIVCTGLDVETVMVDSISHAGNSSVARRNPAPRIRPAAADLGTAMFVTLAPDHLTPRLGQRKANHQINLPGRVTPHG